MPKKVYIVVNYSEGYVVKVFQKSKDAKAYCYSHYLIAYDFDFTAFDFKTHSVLDNSLNKWNIVLSETPCNIRIEKKNIY